MRKELIRYLICGFATMFVSLISYYFLTKTLLPPENPLKLQIANAISWILAVSFSYFISRYWVFSSKAKLLPEFIRFASARLLTLGCDMAIMYVGVTLLTFNDRFVKLVVQVVVTILNYVFSKLLVFRKTSKNQKGENTNGKNCSIDPVL